MVVVHDVSLMYIKCIWKAIVFPPLISYHEEFERKLQFSRRSNLMLKGLDKRKGRDRSIFWCGLDILNGLLAFHLFCLHS
jgi:hypothetical protein